MKRLPYNQLALVAAISASTGFAFHRAFQTTALIVPVLVCAVGATLLGIALRTRWRLAAGPTALVYAVGLFVVVGILLFPAATLVGVPTPASIRDIWDGLINGWVRILSTTLPIGHDATTLVVVAAVVWAAAAIATELGLRTRSVLGPIVPGLIALVIALVFDASGSGSNALVVGAFILFGGLLAVLRTRSADPTGVDARDRRVGTRLALALPVLGGLALVAPILGPQLPLAGDRQPVNLRKYVSTPLQVRQALDPLQELRALLNTPNETLFTVQARQPENWRLVVLDNYDGQTWSAQPDLQRVGTRIPGAGVGSSLSQNVQIEGLAGYFLPAAERPTSVTASDVGYSPATGVLATGHSTIQGLTYHVTSIVPPVPTLNELEASTVARVAPTSPLVSLPASCSSAVAAPARAAVAGGTYDFQRLALLEHYLRDSGLFAYSTKAPTGESCGHLAFFLSSKGRSGTAEQFANAFAVMARSLGYPTRVVVGFRPGTNSAQRGQFIVRGSDANAWVEVLFNHLGWLPFDPTPADLGTAGSKEAKATSTVDLGTRANQAVSQKPPAVRTVPKRRTRTEHQTRAGSSNSGLSATLIVFLVLALILLASGGVLLVKRARRRARRRADTGRGRIIGAWQEVLDRLADGGVTAIETLTVHEVGQKARDLAGVEVAAPLTELGELVNEALFALDGPSSEDATRAWSLANGFLSRWGRSRPIPERIRSNLSLRALTGARRRLGRPSKRGQAMPSGRSP